jgi:hypothetical protein
MSAETRVSFLMNVHKPPQSDCCDDDDDTGSCPVGKFVASIKQEVEDLHDNSHDPASCCWFVYCPRLGVRNPATLAVSESKKKEKTFIFFFLNFDRVNESTGERETLGGPGNFKTLTKLSS